MNNFGFYIKRITITGVNKEPIDEITFTKGANYIVGPSDSGKSYLFETIEFLLGSSSHKVLTPEGEGYNEYLMEIRTYNNDQPYTLFRSIEPAKNFIKQCELSSFYEVKEKIASSKKKYDKFILSLCRIENRYLKYSKKEHRQLIYTYLRKLSCIPTDLIITKKTPFNPERQYITRTLYQTLIEYLLTGKTYSKKSEVEQEQDKVSNREKIKIKSDIYESQIKELKTENDKLKDYKETDDIRKEIINSFNNSYKNISDEINNSLNKKRQLIKSLGTDKSELIYYSELNNRLQLLSKHYNSDLERLSFIDEGLFLINQLQTVKCPICNGSFEFTASETNAIEDNISIEVSIEAEKEKIINRQKDLMSTINENNKKINFLKQNIEDKNNNLNNISTHLISQLQPQKIAIELQLDKIQRELNQGQRKNFINERINQLTITHTQLLEQLKEDSSHQKAPIVKNNSIYKSLCSDLSNILKAISYPEYENITFNSDINIFDFSIDSKDRGSYGTGMRGISYAAVMIALLKHSITNNIPSNRILMLDSPFTAYKAVDLEDGIKQNIIDAFFNYISENNFPFQLIFFDNKDHTNLENINTIRFTKDHKKGRFGLFPV